MAGILSTEKIDYKVAFIWFSILHLFVLTVYDVFNVVFRQKKIFKHNHLLFWGLLSRVGGITLIILIMYFFYHLSCVDSVLLILAMGLLVFLSFYKNIIIKSNYEICFPTSKFIYSIGMAMIQIVMIINIAHNQNLNPLGRINEIRISLVWESLILLLVLLVKIISQRPEINKLEKLFYDYLFGRIKSTKVLPELKISIAETKIREYFQFEFNKLINSKKDINNHCDRIIGKLQAIKSYKLLKEAQYDTAFISRKFDEMVEIFKKIKSKAKSIPDENYDFTSKDFVESIEHIFDFKSIKKKIKSIKILIQNIQNSSRDHPS